MSSEESTTKISGPRAQKWLQKMNTYSENICDMLCLLAQKLVIFFGWLNITHIKLNSCLKINFTVRYLLIGEMC
jgi:hypothetical protein